MKKVLPLVILTLVLGVLFVGILLQSGRLHKPNSEQNLSVLVLNKLGRNFPGAGPVTETGDTLTVQINNWSVVFSKTKDLDSQISALQEIVNNLRIDQTKRLVIDLRFQKAVIRSNE